MENWIGTAAFRKIPTQKTRHGSPLIDSFELVKKDFTGVEDDLPITLPKECSIDDDPSLNIDDRVLLLKT